MTPRQSWIAALRNDGLRIAMLALGCLLILVSPLVGILPGPGGIFVFAGGLVLVLRSSLWARRRYARLKRRWPRWGALADRGMRRRSVLRRQARLNPPKPGGD